MSRPIGGSKAALGSRRVENIPGFLGHPIGWSLHGPPTGSIPREIRQRLAGISRKIQVGFSPEIPAKMPKRKTPQLEVQKPLDAFSEKRPRGRPGVRPSEVALRAENYRRMFWDYRLDKKKKEYVRDKPSEWATRLLTSKTVEDVEGAFQTRGLSTQNEFRPLFPLILQVLRERTFPKKPETQLDFLADSIAARGDVAPRTSRDICEKEPAKRRRRSLHKILRHEYYVECSCGYKGAARDNACRKCGAEIEWSLDELMGRGLC